MSQPVPVDLARNHIVPGERSSRVATLQRMLVNRGYVLTVNGVFDKPTQSATQVIEHTLGFAKYETVGPAVWKAISDSPMRPKGKPLVSVPKFKPKVVDVRRGQQGFVRHPSRRWEKRRWSGVRGVLGHYTGGTGTFQADARFHVQSGYLTAGGAPAIAYAIGIDFDGTIFVFNDHDDLTWHCDGGQNAVWLGVVFRGNADGMTLAQRRSMRWLTSKLIKGGLVPGWPPLAQRRATVHQEVNSTSCPGVKGREQYVQIFRQRGLSFWNDPPRP